MKITFLLPFASDHPIGGFKVVFEYANRLDAKGHDVEIVFPSFTFREDPLRNAWYAARYIQRKLDGSYRPSWFPLNDNVKTTWIRKISDEEMPDSDILIATAWRTARCAEMLSALKGRKFYFIQHLETWNGPEKDVMETWKLPFRKIVISKWLKDIAEKIGEEADYVPNGLDFGEFGIDIDPAERDPKSVLMLYSKLEFKGSSSGIDALRFLKGNGLELNVSFFGTSDPPENAGFDFEYFLSPVREDLRKLYNSNAIFAATSISEGFGLTGAEALMCGCGLVASSNGGHLEYAVHNETALMFEPGDSRMLAECIATLAEDCTLRQTLARKGNEEIRRFNWERSVELFEKALLK